MLNELIGEDITSKVNSVIKSLHTLSSNKDLVHTAVGHNLGAEHPFYDEEMVKQGQIGGLMDYGLYTSYEPVTNVNHSAHAHRQQRMGGSD